jgi:lysozyme
MALKAAEAGAETPCVRTRASPAASALVLAVLAFALTVPTRPASAAPPGTLRGIDVSHWNDVIRWSKVAASGVRFAIMKATEGTSYTDPTYSQNVAGASAAGIAVGAYHFAQPSTKAGDAAAEADHFVKVARNAAGDVLPALDIERTNGLSTSELQAWVRGWLAEVEAKLGVKAMIYTSPGFWRYSMGDTQWFADNGYATLWVAHWGVSSPTVPANDWGGRGWTFWQWTDCWHVDGISGCVDGDRYNGTDLAGGEIAELTVSTPGGGVVTGPRIRCGGGYGRCARLSSPSSSIELSATPDDGASFLGWDGACAAAGTSSTCTVTTTGRVGAAATFGYPLGVTKQGTGDGTVSSSPAGISCGTTCRAVYGYGSVVTLTAAADSASGFGAWGGACEGPAPTCVVTIAAPVEVTASFGSAVSLEDMGPGTRFTWGGRADTRAMGGSYLYEYRAGSSASFPFTGGRVTWYTIEGPAMGEASVAIDGVQKGTFSGYAPRFRSGVARVFGSLGPGTHTITITALGTKVSPAIGTRVVVDAIRAAGVLHLNPRPHPATWGRVSAPEADGGSYAVSGVAGAAASLRFAGTGVSWTTVLGPRMGEAQVWVDGRLARTVDLSSATTTYGAVRTISGLTDTEHVVRIVVAGTRGAHGTGTSVAIDGWTIR